jgi:hypothetical protein
MKIIRLHIVIIFSIYLVSCVPIKKENKESVNTILNNKKLNDTTEKKIALLEKDTLFSFFTSDMNHSQFVNIITESSKENPSFLIETRKLEKSAIGELYSNKPSAPYYEQPCYVFNINSEKYVFDIKFNSSDMISCPDTTLSLLVLQYEEKKQILINDILNLYKTKYGQYTKSIKDEKSFVIAFNNNTDFEGKLASTTIIETYTWKTKPTLQIKYVKLNKIRSYWPGFELKPKIKTNTIYITYFSKEFNTRWKEIEKERIKAENEKLNKHKTSNREDI